MEKTRFWLFLLSLAFLLFLAACGDKEEAANSGTDDDEVEAPDDDGEAADDPPAAADQTLIFARGGDSQSLDYASTQDGESSRITVQIYESLLKFSENSFDVEPSLAEDWEVADDNVTYTFYLREGVKFHDGTDFNAEAVKINFERWSDPDHEFSFKEDDYAYSVYGNQFGGFKGDEGHIIEEINIINDFEIEFVLKEPFGAFLQNMAMSYFAITSPAALEEYGPAINENPVGTGPFQFVSWDKNDKIILDKFEDYWMEGYPKLDRVIFQVIPDNSARLTALRAGEIDIMDGLNPDDYELIKNEPGIQAFERATNNFGYLGFNLNKEPFDNPLVRKAMHHAVDKEGLISLLYAGLAEPAKNPLPPSYLGYNGDIEPYEYNPELAKELLEEAGYGDGFEFDLWAMPVARPYMPDPERAAEVLQANFAEIGLTAKIVTMEWATYLDEVTYGSHDVFMLGWSGTNGDSDYFLGNLLGTVGIPDSNSTFYSNEEVDALLAEARTTIDEVERAALYEEALAIIHEDSPMITLVHSIPVLAGSDRVKDYVPHLSTSEPLTYVELTE
ncbi:peptide/nickel transport system substrate-binding protein [Evansella caseinilytica]|uniref:Peptide/nickel transport system substrate-binding protein n=1 Tax=Evansella caseinilytica TaxID=1503961 RepID=A0A1H3V2V3_9BACI|nr:ABC transporter substrate-binding protein [Evansella caseinilytica]SDZ68379.1 peptide/nickel transport system substrate-binding protein [Evansella caseinilytica]